MYKELIETCGKDVEWIRFGPPQTEEEIRRTEEAVGCTFPKELRELYREIDGGGWCVFSLAQMERKVRSLREFWLSFFEDEGKPEEYADRVERFLFFAGNGCGDYYCCRISPEGVADESVIYIWEHESVGESCCTRVVAADLAELIVRYYGGEI